MYAIVKTGGKQYRVSEGQSLVVERLPAAEGETVSLAPLMLVDGGELLDGDALASATITARVLAHERGPKLRVVKFKPKRGYRRRTGHRQELTRIQIESIARGGGAARAAAGAGAGAGARSSSPAPVRAGGRHNQEEDDGA